MKSKLLMMVVAFLVVAYLPSSAFAQGMEVRSAKVYLQQNDLDKAEEMLRQALEKDPKDDRTHYHLGVIAYYRGKYDKVQEHWEQMRYKKLKKDEKKQYDGLIQDLFRNSFNKASGEFNNGNYEEAAKGFKVAMWANPEDPNSPLFLGYSLLNSQKIDEAIPVLEKVVKADPKNVQAWDGLATAYVQKQDPPNIIRAYTNYIQLAEQPDLNAYLLLRNAYFETGDTAKVFETYEKAIKTYPNEVSLYRDLSSIYAEHRMFDKAVAVLEKGRMQGDDPEILYYLGTVYYNIGFSRESEGNTAEAGKAFKSAVEPLEKYLQYEPKSIDGWDTLGKVYHGLAKVEPDATKSDELVVKGDEYIAKSKELIRTGEGK